jgi:hypothetical protein
MKNTILYLLGFAGTGKLTIAQQIVHRAPFTLIDNHYINNVIFKLITTDGTTPLPPTVWDKTAAIRTTVLETIRELSPPDANFLFTNEIIAGDAPAESVFWQINEVAVERKARFLPVRLLISPDELCRRIVAPERAELFKARNPDKARKKATEMALYTPPKKVDYIDLDVTNLQAEEAALIILSHLRPDTPDDPKD